MNPPFLTLKTIFVCLMLFWWGVAASKIWPKTPQRANKAECCIVILAIAAHGVAIILVIATIIEIFRIAYHAAPQ